MIQQLVTANFSAGAFYNEFQIWKSFYWERSIDCRLFFLFDSKFAKMLIESFENKKN